MVNRASGGGGGHYHFFSKFFPPYSQPAECQLGACVPEAFALLSASLFYCKGAHECHRFGKLNCTTAKSPKRQNTIPKLLQTLGLIHNSNNKKICVFSSFFFLIKQLVMLSILRRLEAGAAGQTKRIEKYRSSLVSLSTQLTTTVLQFNTIFLTFLFSGFERTNKRPDLFLLYVPASKVSAC